MNCIIEDHACTDFVQVTWEHHPVCKTTLKSHFCALLPVFCGHTAASLCMDSYCMESEHTIIIDTELEASVTGIFTQCVLAASFHILSVDNLTL